MNIPELLAPAGDMDKLKTALHFGADAVYVGLKDFSLRNFAGNFTLEELQEAISYAHTMRRKVYVALNMMPYDADFDVLDSVIEELSDIAPDAVIVSDPGVVYRLRRRKVNLKIHISTQANTQNTASAAFWGQMGASRVVLARELSLHQIRKIVKNSDVEIEVFAHGALCISYSGRCFLSLYMTGRDANQGECTQSCRWKYRIIEETERVGEHFRIEEDEHGSYMFNSKDLCALPVLNVLCETGIHSLKIEGRMKSAHYVGITVDVYRHALSLLADNGLHAFKAQVPEMVAELARVSNRGFTTNFLNGTPGPDDYNMQDSAYINQYAFVGTITGKGDNYIDIDLKNPLRTGDRIEFCDRGMVRESLEVTDVFLPEKGQTDFGRSGDTVRLRGKFQAGIHGLVRK